MIKFDGTEYPGSHGDVFEGEPECHVMRTYFWGLTGGSELRAQEKGKRILTVRMWLHDNWLFQKELDDWLREREEEDLANHGTLEILMEGRPTGNPRRRRNRNYRKRYPECTLDRIERVVLPGQQDAAPLYDYVGQLGGWWLEIVLHFTQMKPDLQGAGVRTERRRRQRR